MEERSAAVLLLLFQRINVVVEAKCGGGRIDEMVVDFDGATGFHASAGDRPGPWIAFAVIVRVSPTSIRISVASGLWTESSHTCVRDSSLTHVS